MPDSPHEGMRLIAFRRHVGVNWALRAPDWAEAESAALRPVSHSPHPQRRHACAPLAPMPSPTVLAHHRERALSRLRENVRQAALHGGDPDQLDTITDQVISGVLSPRDANAQVLDIRSRQQQAA